MKNASRMRSFFRTAAITAALLASLATFVSAGGGQRRAETERYDLGSLPAASEYRTDVPKGRGFLGSEAPVLNRSLARINKALGTSLRPDGRLGQIAQWLYDRLPSDKAFPPVAVMDLAVHHLGLPEPVPHMLMTFARDAPRLYTVVAARLARVFKLNEYTHIGGVAERVEGGVLVVIILSRRHIQMAPVPRTLPGPGRLSLEGSLLDGYSLPKLAHTLPSGQTRMELLGKGPGFSVGIDLSEPGRHRIELAGDGPGGPDIIVNFPVYVGVPAEESAETPAEPRRAARPSEAQQRLFDLVNQERARAGLNVLTFDPELSEVALAHSEDMRKNDFVGHVSPTTKGPEDRLVAAGIVTDVAAENVARAGSPYDIHRSLMDSPGHRAAVLHPGVTHIGIGVSFKRVGERPDYIATELFIRRIATLGTDAKVILLAELNGLRKDAGAAALEEDPALSELAAQAAREFLDKPELSEKQVMDRLHSQLEQSPAKSASMSAMLSVVGSLEDAAKRAAADAEAGARAKRLGLGIAQGVRPGFVPNSIVVVLIFAE